jgi:hypothetical protein
MAFLKIITLHVIGNDHSKPLSPFQVAHLAPEAPTHLAL